MQDVVPRFALTLDPEETRARRFAQAMAALANDGVLFKPHLVKHVTDSRSGDKTMIEPEPLRVLPWKK